ncbi:hypothetical protein QZH41_013543 [Actinostola sp. cb2023]|nr:hypothetical protein QZH41_013543 [Actinostola sp. cb2023]
MEVISAVATRLIKPVSLKELQQLHSENRYLRAELENIKQHNTKERELADRKYGNLVCDYDRGREVSGEKFNLKTKAEDLLYMTRKTIISYFATCGEDDSDIKPEEFEFVLALCGIITNMAASPCGREFLVHQENGRLLIDTFVTSLENVPVRRNVKIRSLILMMLYNMSINFRGLQFLIAKSSLIPLLIHLIQGKVLLLIAL